eukprot:5429427-Amphidinium_carterae.1
MNGGYAVPLVVLYDLENILEEFLKDVRVQGIEVSESVQEKVASRFPQLKMLGEGTTRLSHVFGKAAKGAFKGVWEACFTALDVKDFKPTRFYKDWEAPQQQASYSKDVKGKQIKPKQLYNTFPFPGFLIGFVRLTFTFT